MRKAGFERTPHYWFKKRDVPNADVYLKQARELEKKAYKYVNEW